MHVNLQTSKLIEKGAKHQTHHKQYYILGMQEIPENSQNINKVERTNPNKYYYSAQSNTAEAFSMMAAVQRSVDQHYHKALNSIKEDQTTALKAFVLLFCCSVLRRPFLLLWLVVGLSNGLVERPFEWRFHTGLVTHTAAHLFSFCVTSQ